MKESSQKRSDVFAGDFQKASYSAHAKKYFMSLLHREESDDAKAHYDSSPSVTVVFIPKGTKLTEPRTVRFSDAHTHLLVICEDDTEASISVYLEHEEKGGSHVTEVVCGDDSTVTLHCLQRAGNDSWIAQRGKIGTNAHIAWHNASFGGKNIRHALLSTLAGDHSTSDVLWMFHAKNHDEQKLSVKNIFAARSGGGEIVMKGIAEEHGHVKCNGMIQIELAGGGTDTYLTQDVLMLDPTAKVDAIPGLEIKTNDVKASHSATVSRVTAEDLFYFAARGIDEKKAREMYIEGYLAEMTQSINDADMKKQLLSLIEHS